jgi:phosphoglycolate phosphatase-like HAD superfamily hydrolase
LKLVVFDCDGTLVDSQHMIVAAMERAFAGFALPPPGRGEVLSVVSLSLEEAVGRLAPVDRRQDVPALADAYKQSFDELRRDKAHAELSWHNVLTIDECLQMTCDWYKKYYTENRNTEVLGLCVSQIHDYMDKASERGTRLGFAQDKATLTS